MKKWICTGLIILLSAAAVLFLWMHRMPWDQMPKVGDTYRLSDGSTVEFFSVEEKDRIDEFEDVFDNSYATILLNDVKMIAVAEIVDTIQLIIQDGYETTVKDLKRSDQYWCISLIRIKDILWNPRPDQFSCKEGEYLFLRTDLYSTKGKVPYRPGREYVMGIEGVPDYYGSWDMQLNEKIRLDCVDTFEYNMVLPVENGYVDVKDLYGTLKLEEKTTPVTVEKLKKDLNAIDMTEIIDWEYLEKRAQYIKPDGNAIARQWRMLEGFRIVIIALGLAGTIALGRFACRNIKTEA